MILGIDHIVIAGPDLEALASAFSSIGFTVVGGGKTSHRLVQQIDRAG